MGKRFGELILAVAGAWALLPVVGAAQGAQPVRFLPHFSNIGLTQPGTLHIDPATAGTYTMSGGGADMWGTADAFSFGWVRMTGDGSLEAEVTFTQPLAYPIAKAVLMFRQSLAPGSPYADIAIHGDGHITLQYRAAAGSETKDTTLPEHGPTRLRIERRGSTFTACALFADGHAGTPASITLPLTDPVYVGLGVGSHNTAALQTAQFSHVKLKGAAAVDGRTR